MHAAVLRQLRRLVLKVLAALQACRLEREKHVMEMSLAVATFVMFMLNNVPNMYNHYLVRPPLYSDSHMRHVPAY